MNNYITFPAHKRTIIVRYDKNHIEKYFVQFPKTIFTEYRERLYCFALNKQNEICYMPLFNISEEGAVCLVYQNPEDMGESITLKGKIQKFFSEPYKICGDGYSQSVNKYLDLKMPISVEVNPKFLPKIKEKLRKLYEKPIDLIKCNNSYYIDLLLKDKDYKGIK